MHQASNLAKRLFCALTVILLFVAPALAQDGYQTPPDALAKLVDAPDTPGVSLSPDRSHLLLMHQPQLRLGQFAHQPTQQRAESQPLL